MECPSDEQDLNILLRFRNSIAHGDRKMPIDFDRIDKISKIAIKISTDFAVSVDEACKQKIWMK
ncbi:MAE_28990/MAE_18760 family HEPN-like nuclease [Chitinimonas sp. JJ19]|uniref:MAE_28990/MAE_18760 family HEPN-like nuclease n=1 Tax=Chitinimonas sp. JJ19 TaxID=3109352 RepID=UPI003FA59CCD